MRHKLFLSLLLLSLAGIIMAQNVQVNGINHAEMIYRNAPDSLNIYFKDSFAFNLGLKNFRFGMKLVGELPKYSNQASELMQELDSNRLLLQWKELYAQYEKDAFLLHAGTTEESFGQGITFRSFEDTELDEDHRLESFLIKYDDDFKFKSFYGAIENPENPGKLDLAFGADAQVSTCEGLQVGASALGFRDYRGMNRYKYRDVFSGRILYSGWNLDAYAEYAISEQYRKAGGASQGKAFYTNVDYLISIIQIGGAYKNYEDFSYRLNDLPMANHHDEPLADSSAGGMDEEGWQARFAIYPWDMVSYSANYAEAWDKAKELKMSDLYLEASFSLGADWILGFSQIEKLNDTDQIWQKEYYPSISSTFGVMDLPTKLLGEFKTIEKDIATVKSEHYEPKLQMDLGIKKLNLSLTVSSYWQDFESIMDSQYKPALEIKYPVFAHSDLILFAGKEAGGKVCRNGSCRFVAPFEGIKAELITSF